MSLTAAIVDGICSTPTYTPEQRIANGGFDSGASWTIISSSWAISGGVATRSGGIGAIRQTITAISAKRSYSLSVAVTNAVGAALTISLLDSGAPVQAIYSGTPSTGTLWVVGYADFAFDGIQFASTGATGLQIDDVSLTA